MEFNELYFYTSEISGGNRILSDNKYKEIVINCLQRLAFYEKVRIFGYIILPNKIHLLWEFLELNGSEFPCISFINYSNKQLYQSVKSDNPQILPLFKTENNSDYEFWLSHFSIVQISTLELAYKKLLHIHNLPFTQKWKLCTTPNEYEYSSAPFYRNGVDKYGFLTHIDNRF